MPSNPFVSWLPSQNGFVLDPPQRQSSYVSPVSPNGSSGTHATGSPNSVSTCAVRVRATFPRTR